MIQDKLLTTQLFKTTHTSYTG